MIDRNKTLVEELRPFGVRPENVIPLDGPESPDQLPYLDLRRPLAQGGRLPDAVVEVEHRPVLYVIRGPQPPSEIARLRHVLGQRDQADYLAISEPGLLMIAPVDSRIDLTAIKSVAAKDASASSTIPRLAFNLDDTNLAKYDFHDRLFRLLASTTETISQSTGVASDVALSWVGRALFLRFLVDREIVHESDLPQVCKASTLTDCFRTPALAKATSKWLDRTFNGDLLPLKPRHQKLSFWKSLSRDAQENLCLELSKIMLRTDEYGQRSFGWDTLNFDHIPVGLLSQIYENYSHHFETSKARKESIHYTPRAIAEYVVDEALYSLEDADVARILDPSAGAGVFLVAAFRALVRERWRRSGRRPRREEIRTILYNQIVGFDINDIALRLAALSLYLTALELDPDPKPIHELRFSNLRGTVLYDVRSKLDKELAKSDFPMLGSLGKHIGKQHVGAYDVVLGNPPWTAWKRPKSKKGSGLSTHAQVTAALFDERVGEVESVISKTIATRLGSDAGPTYKMVDFVPDLPFCWRALEWLRPRGRLAFALHARLLFKQSITGVHARELLFRSIRITGILNGARLRKTAVWPSVDATFCLLFAQNTRPSDSDSFYYLNPELEDSLNRRGVLRIDAASATPVSIMGATKQPALLKTLYRGNELDATILTKIDAQEMPSVQEYWKTELGIKPQHGFQVGLPTQKRVPADKIFGLPEFTTDDAGSSALILPTNLETLAYDKLRRPCNPEIYRGPLVLVPESPPTDTTARCRAYFCAENIAYSESFLGFSCANHSTPMLLAEYLLVVFTSELLPYIALLRSSKFGVERDSYLLSDVKSFPLPPLQSLSDGDLEKIHMYAEQILEGNRSEGLNEFVARVYGLTSQDYQVISDTLAVSSPFHASKLNSQRPPTDLEIESFCKTLELYLHPFFQRRNRSIRVSVLRGPPGDPWIPFRVCTERGRGPTDRSVLQAFFDEANRQGSSLVIYRDRCGLTVGMLAQYRYWTRTRARLLALKLRQLHEDFLAIGDMV